MPGLIVNRAVIVSRGMGGEGIELDPRTGGVFISNLEW